MLCRMWSFSASLMLVSGAILSTFVPLPRKNERTLPASTADSNS
jgi:hypothetical protein